jgi:hypothetical protein
MNATTTGLLAGLILGVAGSIGGFGPFLITLVVGIVGLLVDVVAGQVVAGSAKGERQLRVRHTESAHGLRTLEPGGGRQTKEPALIAQGAAPLDRAPITQAKAAQIDIVGPHDHLGFEQPVGAAAFRRAVGIVRQDLVEAVERQPLVREFKV